MYKLRNGNKEKKRCLLISYIRREKGTKYFIAQNSKIKNTISAVDKKA